MWYHDHFGLHVLYIDYKGKTNDHNKMMKGMDQNASVRPYLNDGEVVFITADAQFIPKSTLIKYFRII